MVAVRDEEFEAEYAERVRAVARDFVRLVARRKEQAGKELDDMVAVLIEFLLFTGQQQHLYTVVAKELFALFGNDMTVFAN